MFPAMRTPINTGTRRLRQLRAGDDLAREAHAMPWIELALNRGLGRDWAFALLRR